MLSLTQVAAGFMLSLNLFDGVGGWDQRPFIYLPELCTSHSLPPSPCWRAVACVCLVRLQHHELNVSQDLSASDWLNPSCPPIG